MERTSHTWVQQLPLAEFASNNAISVNTSFSPFYLNAGIHPVLPTSLMTGGLPKTTNEAVQITLERMKMALAEAQANLALAQKRMATAVNRSGRFVEYNVGDEVVLITKRIKNYCPHVSRLGGLGPSPSNKRSRQWLIGWICLLVGISTPSSILTN